MNFPQTSARLVRGFRSLARFRPHTHLSNSPASCQNLSQSSSSSTPEETVVGDISRVPIVKRPPASVRRVGIEEDSDSTNAMIVKTGQWRTFDPMYLRDSCICQRCVDPSSKQKNFQTTDIPENIRAKYAYLRDDQSITISWENDIPGFGDKHLTLLPKRFFDVLGSRDGVMAERFHMTKPKIWNKEFITKNLQYVNYHDYMTTIEGLYRAVVQLHYYGLLLIRDVPGIRGVRSRHSESHWNPPRFVLWSDMGRKVHTRSQKCCIHCSVPWTTHGSSLHGESTRLPIFALHQEHL